MVQTPTEIDPLIDKGPARYVIGVDLGTTNSAVMYVDTQGTPWRVQSLPIPQLVTPGQVEPRDTLPSFHFQSLSQVAEEGGLRLPWHTKNQDWVVGVMARDEGTKSPARLIASAKSWLCHTGVDRAAKLLPWQGAPEVERLSPVEATARYLSHIRDVWNDSFRSDPLADQDIVITLPASFDEVARQLTVEAASLAELPNVVLIEEPQAAFYAWVYKHQDDWPERVAAGDTILVCDIGGGTTDFTLIKVRQADDESEQRVQFHRVAVGDHLILGGDNLDLALAHHIEGRLASGGKLAPNQWDVLVRSCRRVKEELLGPESPERATVNLPGSGSRLIGGGLRAEVTLGEVEDLLVNGFLPLTSLAERPTSGQSGFREFGLPYASDPAISKHLAAFLAAHGEAAGATGKQPVARPDVILFNGGFFASPQLRKRLLDVLERWFSQDASQPWSPEVLDNDRLDLAVARGAAYYGMVRRGEGVRITANLARSYYVEVETGGQETSAVCLVPGHAEPGQTLDLKDRELELAIAQPVEFSLHVSSTRLTDEPGAIVPVQSEEMSPLPPIRTVLRTERKNQTGTIPVTLHAHLSEIGTIDLWCQAKDGDRRWRLQFDVRSATQTDIEAHETEAEVEGFVDESSWSACERAIQDVFGADATQKPGALMKQLATVLDSHRDQWPTSLLRRMWELLIDQKEGRRKSPAHEARWLNLLGFALRPGYGLAVDDWRVAETWRHVRGKLAHGGASQVESLILWRRIAGGFSVGQQKAIAEPLVAALRNAHAASTSGKKSRGSSVFAMHESSEVWRLLGSLELLDVPVKVQLGDMIVDLLPKKKYEKMQSPMVWALGRLGQRQPLYGPLNTVVPTSKALAWCESIQKVTVDPSTLHTSLMQLARCTGDRHRDLELADREVLAGWLVEQGATTHLAELIRVGGTLASEEQHRVFGESLPKGLRIR